MKARASFMHKLGSVLVAVTLGGCSPFPAVSGADSSALPTGSHSAPQASPVTVTGQLVLFGPEMDAWLGVRDATGRVTRLVFSSTEEFQNQRLRQNQKVIVVGLPLPAHLGRPQVQVTSLQVQP